MIKQALGAEGVLEVGDGVGGLGRKQLSTQVRGEGDVDGVRALKVGAPCRLSQQSPPCPWPWRGSVAAEGYHRSVTPCSPHGSSLQGIVSCFTFTSENTTAD